MGLLRRLVSEEEGQALVEYAMLLAFVSLATIAGISALHAAIQGAYGRWDTAIQRCWQMPDPGTRKPGGC